MFKKTPLLFFLFTFQFGFSQSEVTIVAEIKNIITESGSHLSKLECDKSLILAKKALEKAILINDNELIARSYNIIGLNLDEYYDFAKAIFFFNKGLEYANKTESDFIKYSLHNNVGRTLSFRNIDYKKGIYHYKMGLYYAKLLKDDYEIMYANINIATAYFAIDDYNNGFPYLKTVKSSVENGEELEAKISYNSLIGGYYSYKNNFVDSEKSYKKALEFCGENKPEFLEDNATEVYDDIARMYSKKGDFKNAYLYMDKYNVLKEKHYNDDHSKVELITGMGAVLDEYKRQINQIEIQKLRQDQIIYQTKVVGILFIILFLIFILLLISLYKGYIFKKKTNLKLIEANKKLKIAKEKAEEVSNLKTQFVSTVSHELRTPLYGVVGITNIISEIHTELEDSPYLNSLKFSANHLLTLVNDILQFNKIEGQKIILENSVFNLTEEINTFLFSLQFLANKNNNEIICKIDEKIPKLIIGDRLHLSQILINLISNSIKFTTNGTIKICADLIKTEGKFNYIRFEVSDNGIGIDEKDQYKIFDSFVQLSSEKSDYQGTGLGLSIVQKLIELFESKIFLESKVGEGTSINFTIAFEDSSIDSIEYNPDCEVDFSLNVINILLVEDNKINQLVTKKILEKLNYKCHIVEVGAEAIEILKKETFDLILMDINMPGMNGFETTIKIRQNKITTPIIALTAFSKHEIEQEAIDSGMDAVVIKPYKKSELYSIMSELIKKNAD